MKKLQKKNQQLFIRRHIEEDSDRLTWHSCEISCWFHFAARVKASFCSIVPWTGAFSKSENAFFSYNPTWLALPAAARRSLGLNQGHHMVIYCARQAAHTAAANIEDIDRD